MRCARNQMTVMFDRFFGVPQQIIRSGLWAKMKPTEQSVYICLLHESERYRSRELARTDYQLREIVGVSSRALCNARKKLVERRLVQCVRRTGNVYVYTLCNLETGLPWPGNPKTPVLYQKKTTDIHTSAAPAMQPVRTVRRKQESDRTRACNGRSMPSKSQY